MAATVNLDQLARFFGVTPRWVNRLVLEGMPRVSRGRYQPLECASWYIRHLQHSLEARSNGEPDAVSALTTARTHRAVEISAGLALDNARRRSQLVQASDVEHWRRSSIELMQRLAGPLPARMLERIRGLDERAQQAALGELARELLKRMASDGRD